MSEAMHNLGLIDEDLNTKKTRDDFQFDDYRVTDLHFQTYQKRLLVTINALLAERKKIRVKTKDQTQTNPDDEEILLPP